ncbi:MAG: glycosyltransferase family 2 protein [Desulfatirhabdiaceae bacterium]
MTHDISHPAVTVGIVNYNGSGTLFSVIESVLVQDYSEIQILVVDNASTDGSPEAIQKRYPGLKCIHMDRNRGPAAARNVILNHVDTPYILFLDNDIVLEPDVVGKLVRIMGSHPEITLCHPEIRDHQDPDAHHYNGGWIHYLGSFISRQPPHPADRRPEFEVFDTVSGAAMMVMRMPAIDAGGFDEDYFFNWEDGDFCIRLTLMGYRCVNAPSAVVYHQSKSRGTSKVFYQARNRWFFMLKLYSWRSLALFLPMLAVFELGQIMLVLFKGGIRDYLKGLAHVIQSWPSIRLKRNRFQPHKQITDRDWLKSGVMFVPRQLSGNGMTLQISRILFSVFDLWWRIIRSVM